MRIAFLAQLAEQLTRNEQVAGSSPVEGSKKKSFSSEAKGLFVFLEVSSGVKNLQDFQCFQLYWGQLLDCFSLFFSFHLPYFQPFFFTFKML